VNFQTFPTRTLQETIQIIKNLPDQIMLHQHGIQVGYGEETEVFFGIARETYWAIGMWLELYLLHNLDPLLTINLNLSPNCHYKPLAVRAKAFYELAFELYTLAMSNKKPCLKAIAEAKLTPQNWMLLCEGYICKAGLRNSYYGDHTVLDQQNQETKGKTQLYNSARNYYAPFTEDNLVSLKFAPATPESGMSLTWIQVLECTGAAIAKEDSQFRNLHWLPYRATQLRIIREINNSKFLKAIKTNPDGSLEALEKGKRGKGKGKNKGEWKLTPQL
jgi:hypothetical protein